MNASLAPTVATVKQDNAKLEYQSASFDWPTAKAFLKAVAYILCAVFVLSSLVIYYLVTMQQSLA